MNGTSFVGSSGNSFGISDKRKYNTLLPQFHNTQILENDLKFKLNIGSNGNLSSQYFVNSTNSNPNCIGAGTLAPSPPSSSIGSTIYQTNLPTLSQMDLNNPQYSYPNSYGSYLPATSSNSQKIMLNNSYTYFSNSTGNSPNPYILREDVHQFQKKHNPSLSMTYLHENSNHLNKPQTYGAYYPVNNFIVRPITPPFNTVSNTSATPLQVPKIQVQAILPSTTNSSIPLELSNSQKQIEEILKKNTKEMTKEEQLLTIEQRRKHQCKICMKKFTTAGHLTRHHRIHTGEKNHKCPHEGCNLWFSRNDNSLQHYQTHLKRKSKKGKPGRKMKIQSKKPVSNRKN